MVFEFLKDIGARHEALKKRIHSFRIPLSPAGQRIMGVVYFTLPILAGMQIMEWAKGKAIVNLGTNAEKLRNSENRPSDAATNAQNVALKNVLAGQRRA